MQTAEKRLIDANLLGRDAFHIKQWGKGIRCVVDWDDIEAAPTVDAVPVVHGHWIEHLHLEVGGECSVCGWQFQWFENAEAHYCPHCGAKMDGGDTDG